MIKYCLDKWNANSQHLREVIKSEGNSGMNRYSYFHLVQLVITEVFNFDEHGHHDDTWNPNLVYKINGGAYTGCGSDKGTFLYVIPKYVDCPACGEYLITFVEYGSCSLCDTLKAIQNCRSYGALTEQQINDYMTICKDIVTNTIKPYNFGWRNDKEYDLVEFE